MLTKGSGMPSLKKEMRHPRLREQCESTHVSGMCKECSGNSEWSYMTKTGLNILHENQI